MDEGQQQRRNAAAMAGIKGLLELLRKARPGDRSETDRWYQITITDLEKIAGSFRHNVVER